MLDFPRFDPQVAKWLAGSPAPAFGPGVERRSTPADFRPGELFAGRKVVDHDAARACEAGLWLWFDRLDRSHTISQAIETSEGSFWHAIMHRREPDYENAKYWFRQVGEHVTFPEIAGKAAPLVAKAGREAAACVVNGQWRPMALVDLCRMAARGSEDLGQLCVDLAVVEWESLFLHCFRLAEKGV